MDGGTRYKEIIFIFPICSFIYISLNESFDNFFKNIKMIWQGNRNSYFFFFYVLRFLNHRKKVKTFDLTYVTYLYPIIVERVK